MAKIFIDAQTRKKRYKQLARAPQKPMLWTLLALEMDKYFPPEQHHTS